MNRKVLAIFLVCTTILAGCGNSGKGKNDDSAEPEIVARNEMLRDIEVEVTQQEDVVTSDEEIAVEEYQPDPVTLSFENGIELATVRSSKGSLPISSGDNLRDVLMLSGLRYIAWDQTDDENDVFSFYGKGYALKDVRKGGDDGYEPSYVYFESVDANDLKMGSLKPDKSLYRICAVKVSADDENDGDLEISFTNSVKIGMTKKEIDEALAVSGIKGVDYGNTTLYKVDDKQVLYISYDKDANAETIYSMPSSLVDVKHFVDMAKPKNDEKKDDEKDEKADEDKED